MKQALALILGGVAAYFLVFVPIKAKGAAYAAIYAQIDDRPKLSLLAQIHEQSPCDTDILDALGTRAALVNEFGISTWAFGQAMACAPSQALIRLKYGAAMINWGFNGLFAIKEAGRMEPNNPIFKAEIERATKFRLPSL